jgi:opacity protein-like surface antigen
MAAEIKNMVRRQILLCLAGILALMIITGGAARAETYTELFIGGVHTENEHIPFSLLHRYPNGVSAENCAVPGRIHLAINQSGTAGARLGTWFAREGFPRLDYPQWMRYFGCYVDFSYHRLDYRPQQLDTVSIDNTPPVFGMKAVPNDRHTNRFLSEANVFTIAFMASARYGFFPTDRVPFGRLQPYIGLGPGIFIMDQEVTVQTMSYQAETRMFGKWFNISPQSNTSVCVALVADAGVRWMFTEHLSADLFFRFRRAQPGFTYKYRDPLSARYANFTMHPTFDIYSIQFGLAYHF